MSKQHKFFRDWQGNFQPVPVVEGKVCDYREDLALQLIQQGRNKFAIIYGLEVMAGLSYHAAAREYGFCLLHALAHKRKLDNS